MYHHQQQRNNHRLSSSSKLLDYASPRPIHPSSTNTIQKNTTTRSFSSSSSSLPKTWKKNSIIESYGDYRQEMELEKYIGGPLYEHQDTLPRLPVPTIDETMKRFLPTVLPFVKNQKEKDELLDAIHKFPKQAQVLQERLYHRAHDEFSNSSFLQLWWNTTGYLDIRDPIVINVSYFFHYSDDPTAITNIKRSAAMLTAVAQFRKDVCTGQLPPETIGKKPRQTILDSTPYKYMFHACRIPRYERDYVKIYDPSIWKHVVVARKGHFFTMDFIDKQTHDALPLATLEESLQNIIHAADEAGPPLLDIGVLTSQNRDAWADARQVLSSTKAGIDALELLQQGAILLCLDDVSPISRQECGTLFWHGNYNNEHGSEYNRWFDKSIQLFCTNNGKAGLLGEHALMDGMPSLRLSDTITKMTYESIVKKEQEQSNNNNKVVPVAPPHNIFQNVLPEIVTELKPHVDKAKIAYHELTNNHELQVQSFQRYGSNYMKQSGFSPDAYVQMIMQLATYRLWEGTFGGTYEATQVRPFLHGRTETTRTISPDSVAFCHSMGLVPSLLSSSSTTTLQEHEVTEKLDLFRKAVSTHVAYIKNAARGYGVDRHFLGLSMLIKDGEDTIPDLFQNELYKESKTWRVSTSHLTHPRFDNWGYGEVVPHGVGLAYGIQSECCIFNITALKEHGWVESLSHHLEEALLEIQILIEMEKKKKNETTIKSRL